MPKPPMTLAEARIRHARYYQTRLRTYENMYYDGIRCDVEVLLKFDLERLQIDRGLDWARERARSLPAAARILVAYTLESLQIMSIRQSPRVRLGQLIQTRLACYRLGDRRGELLALRSIASTLLDLGDTKRAKRRYLMVLARANNDDFDTRSATLCGLGRLYANAGDVNAAIECSEQAIPLCKQIGSARREAIALSNLARAHTAAANYEQAIRYAQCELDITRSLGDRHGEADALGGLGNAHHGLGNLPEALEHHQESVAICREIGDHQGESNELYNSSMILSKLGRKRQALATAEVAIKLYQELESPYIAEALEFFSQVESELASGQHPSV